MDLRPSDTRTILLLDAAAQALYRDMQEPETLYKPWDEVPEEMRLHLRDAASNYLASDRTRRELCLLGTITTHRNAATRQAARIAALEAALRALVDGEPWGRSVVDDGDGYMDEMDGPCRYCGHREYGHTDDCPWVAAKALLPE